MVTKGPASAEVTQGSSGSGIQSWGPSTGPRDELRFTGALRSRARGFSDAPWHLRTGGVCAAPLSEAGRPGAGAALTSSTAQAGVQSHPEPRQLSLGLQHEAVTETGGILPAAASPVL